MSFKIKLIFLVMTGRSRKNLVKMFGKAFYNDFVKLSKQYLDEMLPSVPDIGKSIFSLNYNYGP